MNFHLRSGILLALALIVSPDDGGATNYYVDSSHGNDSYNGLAPEHVSGDLGPWRSLAFVSAQAFSPGDSMLFRRDEVWRETLDINRSGENDASIVYGAYGDGARPIISGGDALSDWQQEVVGFFTSLTIEPYRVIVDKEWLEPLRGPSWAIFGAAPTPSPGDLQESSWYWDDTTARLHVRLAGDESPAGHLIEASQRAAVSPTNGHHLTLTSLCIEMSNADHPGILLMDQSHSIQISDCVIRYNWRSGLSFNAPTGDVNSLVENNHCYYNGSAQITAGTGDASLDMTGLTIRGNVCHHGTLSYYYTSSIPDGYGIKLFYVNESQIDHNICYANERTGLALDGTVDPGQSAPPEQLDGCDRNVLEYNECYLNGSSGLQIEAGSDENIVRYNYCHENGLRYWSGGICVTNVSFDNQIYYNIVHGHGDPETGGNGALYMIRTGSRGTQIYNNLAVSGPRPAIGFRVAGDLEPGQLSNPFGGEVLQDCKIINNIYLGDDRALWLETAGTLSGFESNHNCWHSPHPTAVRWLSPEWGAQFGAVADFQAATGHDLASLEEDPLLAVARMHDPPSSNLEAYRLSSESPCIERGLIVGLSHDIAASPLPQGDTVECGVFEYVDTPQTVEEPEGSTEPETNSPIKLNDLRVFPNPVRRKSFGQIELVGLTPGSHVKIFSATGHLIDTLVEISVDRARWDLADSNGRAVPSGRYVALVQDGRQNLHRSVGITVIK